MDLWPGGMEKKPVVARVEGDGRLSKDKTVKIRMDELEIRELDAVGKTLGFAERATTLRWLVKHYPEVARASLVLNAMREVKDKQDALNALLSDRV